MKKQIDSFRGRAGTKSFGLLRMDPPSDSELDWLSDWFENVFPKDIPKPFLYPSDRIMSGVQMEWTFGGFEVSFEVGLNDKIGIFDIVATDVIPNGQVYDKIIKVDMTSESSLKPMFLSLRQLRVMELNWIV